MVRLVKTLKFADKYLDVIASIFKLPENYLKLIGFFFVLMILVHITSCLYIVAATDMGDIGEA